MTVYLAILASVYSPGLRRNVYIAISWREASSSSRCAKCALIRRMMSSRPGTCRGPRALAVADVADSASGFVLEWNLSHEVTGCASKDKFDSWSFSLLHYVNIDGPRHDVVYRMAKRVGTLDLWAP